MAISSASHLATIAAYAAAGGTAVLFLYAMGLRISHILQARTRQRVRNTWWPVFAEAATSERRNAAARLPRTPRRHLPVVLREWCGFRNSVRGASVNRLNALARHAGLLALARDGLDSRHLGRKLLAVQAIGLLKDLPSWHAIQSLLEHKSIALSITAAAALVDIDARRAVPLVIPLICSNDRWPRTQIAKLLANAGPDNISDALCAAITSSTDSIAARLLRYADCISTSQLNQLLDRLLVERQAPDLLAAALKVARGLNCYETVVALTQHKAWYVRMQAAAVLGQFGTRTSIRHLEPLMSDPEWWVRYRAAQAIASLPFLGPHALRRLRERQTDRYARDMLQQVLAERGVA
ncbi:MAG TPA: HEAT repeat domain-containing protein [Woeseiaceae bacterium]|nr:HEAT repeat domain-containing protein [Woeseiaceae bacterium]